LSLAALNEYEEENIQVIRFLTRGATELIPDAAGRVLLPKFLLEYAGIKSDIVISLLVNKIEVWDAEAHKELMKEELGNMAPMVQRVLGNKAGRGND
jgi:MraZ protein